MTNPPENTPADVTVWYDSECPLCVREIKLMRQLDKRRVIDFVEIQSLFGSQELEVAVKLLFRHAVCAAEIAPVRHRDSKIPQTTIHPVNETIFDYTHSRLPRL